MQRLFVLTFLVLFSSCWDDEEEVEKETRSKYWQKVDEGVYESVSPFWGIYTTEKYGNRPAGIIYKCPFKVKFTHSPEDETTYFIIEHTQGKRTEGPPSDGHGYLAGLQFTDVHGNILYEFDIESLSSKYYRGGLKVSEFRRSDGKTIIKGTNERITKSILERTDALLPLSKFQHKDITEWTE
jgi:hypothetical protein